MAKQTFTTGQVLTAAQMNSLQSNDFNQTVDVKTAAYTLVATDKGKRIEFNTSGSVTCTVNTGLFDAGDTLIIQNRGAGTVTITAGTATVNTSASLALAQYSAGTLYFVSASAALFFGDAAGISASIVDAKGDLIVGTADNTVGRLAVGTNGYTLVADSAETTGLKWAAPSSGALTLIKKQTIGSAVSSVTVSDAFSSTYDNYKVIVTGGAGSTNINMFLTLGATNSGYYYAGTYIQYSGSGGTIYQNSNANYFDSGYASANGLSIDLEIQSPNLAKRTSFLTRTARQDTTGYVHNYQGFLDNATQYTAFTLTTNTGTVTGGEIRVYGYQNS